MKIRKVLILYKKSTFQLQALEHKEPTFLKLVAEGHETVTRVKVAHDEHYEALEKLGAELARRGIEYRAVARADLTDIVEDVDLVISVGGDGTFLDASHNIHSVPLLGINSSRSSSFGHFCLANGANLESIFDQIESGRLEPHRLLRLELTLNGSPIPELVLNEVLVCHRNPAGTSRYFISIGGIREEHRSGGVWIGTAAGSTGALRAASGVVQSVVDRRYQYVVREPGPRPYESWRLLRGLIEPGSEIHIVSQMRTGSLYIDGQHIDYGFGLGDELVVRAAAKDLIAYVSPDCNDVFMR